MSDTIKVYCGQCKHLTSIDSYHRPSECKHPKNMGLVSNPLYVYIESINRYEEINRDNNCPWYEPCFITRLLRFLCLKN